MYPIKLKVGMLDLMSNTFRNTIFEISVDLPLRNAVNKKEIPENENSDKVIDIVRKILVFN